MWSVFFVFLSYLDRNVVRGDFLSSALDAEKESREMFSMINGTFCAKMSLIGENVLYQVSDGAEVVRTVVSPSGKLVTCSVVVNQMEVKSFLHECRLGLKKRRAGHQLEARFARIDEDKLLCREFNLRSEGSSAAWKNTDTDGGQEKVLKRSKRGFTYPGTLWCGAGNMADNYNQLGKRMALSESDDASRLNTHMAVTSYLQESLQTRTAAVGLMTTALMSSTPSHQTMDTLISNGTPSPTVTAMMSE